MTLIRRELRTLTPDELGLFFDSLRVLRNITDDEGRSRFGQDFRSYDYMMFKHSVSALHGCADQGHLVANQVTFHRALMMEFERALLAVARGLNPSTTLSGLPYWDWSIDHAAHGHWFQSSLWKYWGSPFGNPDNQFCIADPFFNATVPTTTTTEHLHGIMVDVLGDDALRIGNAFGFWRSPWSPSKCPGVTRNPARVFGGKEASLGALFTHAATKNCPAAPTFNDYATCIQGHGFGKIAVDFGPHNMPHILMGTFDDAEFASDMLSLFALLVCASFAVVGGTLGCICSMPTNPRLTHPKSTSPRLSSLCGRWAIVSIGVGLFVAGFTFSHTFQGIHAGYNYMQLQSLVAPGRTSVDFNGVEWRNNVLQCPVPASCQTAQHTGCEAECVYPTVLWGDLKNHFTGSDFWDGAFSPNELFFFSVHAYVDKLNFEWAVNENPHPGNDFGWRHPDHRVDGCFGTALGDDISHEMCFTVDDIGVGKFNIAANGTHRAHASAASPNLPCLTHRDVLRISFDNETATYAYDSLVEQYTWRAMESRRTCPPAPQVCAAESPIVLKGSITCVEEGRHVVNDEKCAQLRKPAPPETVCDCTFETFKQRTEAMYDNTLWSLPHSLGLVGLVVCLVGGCAIYCAGESSAEYVKLENVESPEEDYERGMERTGNGE